MEESPGKIAWFFLIVVLLALVAVNIRQLVISAELSKVQNALGHIVRSEGVNSSSLPRIAASVPLDKPKFRTTLISRMTHDEIFAEGCLRNDTYAMNALSMLNRVIDEDFGFPLIGDKERLEFDDGDITAVRNFSVNCNEYLVRAKQENVQEKFRRDLWKMFIGADHSVMNLLRNNLLGPKLYLSYEHLREVLYRYGELVEAQASTSSTDRAKVQIVALTSYSISRSVQESILSLPATGLDDCDMYSAYVSTIKHHLDIVQQQLASSFGICDVVQRANALCHITDQIGAEILKQEPSIGSSLYGINTLVRNFKQNIEEGMSEVGGIHDVGGVTAFAIVNVEQVSD